MSARPRVHEMLKRGIRASLNPALAWTLGRAGDDIGRSIVVAGAPRSGTTWLAELLCHAPRTAMLFEPFHPDNVGAARAAGFGWSTCVPRATAWPRGRAYAGRALAGRVRTPWTLGFVGPRQVARRQRWIVKCVRANMFLPWLADAFDLRAAVLLVRHPCAVIASQMRQGWVLEHPPICPGFGEAWPEAAKLLDGLNRPEQYMAALWAMRHLVPLQALGEPWLHVVSYEHLVSGGRAAVADLAAELGLDLDAKKLLIDRPSQMARGRPMGAGRSGPLCAWQRDLSGAVIDRILDVVRAFGLNFYDRGAEPNGDWPPPRVAGRARVPGRTTGDTQAAA